MSGEGDIPVDYKFVDWEQLYHWVGRAFVGDHVPMMSDKVAKYLEDQASQLRRAADRLTRAAKVIKALKEDK